MANNSKAISLGQGATNDTQDGTTRTQRVTIYDESGIPIEVNSRGQLKVVLDGRVDENNSSSTPLLASTTFNGVAVDTLDYALVFITVYSDVASATDGLCVQVSSDNVTWRNGDVFTIAAATEKTFSIQTNKKYYRICYENGIIDQTVFDLHVVLKKTNSKPSSHRINDAINPQDDATLQKSVLTAQKDNLDFINITSTDSGNLRVANVEDGLSIAKGDVSNTSSVSKFGDNPDIDTATTPEDIWEFGSLYTFSTVADIDSISSSNVGDTQEVIIQGLDTNWELVEQTITLNGQTRVALTTTLIRCFRFFNTNSTDFIGTIYIYVNGAITAGVPDTDADVRAIVINGHNQTLMAIYTVPAGKTAYFMSAYVALSNTKTTSAIMTFRARLFGSVFRIINKIAIQSTGNSNFIRTPSIPGTFPEKTDVLIRCDEVTANDTAISAGFDLVLVDN